jgi:signal transduction histidine kinase
MRRKRPPIADVQLNRAREILAGTPLPSAIPAEEYSSLTASYELLLRRLHKTLVISDSYHKQLHDLNHTLSQRVEEETERRLAQERLLTQHARLAAMGEMIDAIAHQWRQPLTTLSVLVQTIREAGALGKLDDRILTRTTDSALNLITYMSETIATFRGFFRPDKQIVAFSASKTANEAVSLLRSRFNDNNISVEIATNPGNDTLWGCPNEVIQVIVNLLANSCDAIMERMNSEAHLSTGNDNQGEITIRISPAEQQVVMEVIDNGNGIPSESASRLFDPDFSTKKNHKGTGLGLYMSRLLVEQSMGGKVSFTSVPNRTVFRLELPKNGISP